MRVRDHLALSSAGAAVLAPCLHGRAAGLWAGGVLLDLDHYVWFCARHRTTDPRAAVRFFNGANVPREPAARLLHSQAALVLMLLLGTRRKWALPIALGAGAHIALDAYHELRMIAAREEALRRDDFVCRGCGTRAADVGTHLWQQPRLLPSYQPQNLVSLCAACHRLAHTDGGASWN